MADTDERRPEVLALTPAAVEEEVGEDADLQEFGVEARSQWRTVARRFVRHRLAMVALTVLVVMFLLSLVGGRFWSYSYTDLTSDYSVPPSLEHPFGTDEIGKDTFAAVLRGAQKSLQVALTVALLSTTVGTVVGALAGYYRGWVDNLLMRVTDLFLILPALAVLLVMSSRFATGPGKTLQVALVLAALFWMPLARIVRSTFLSLREREFVEAARALGASDARIIFRHLLPNSVGVIVVNATLSIAVAILIETALSFLGFGIQPPDVSLGALVDSGVAAARTRWWLFYLPGIYLIVLVLAINFVGDGLRDAFDPQQMQVRE